MDAFGISCFGELGPPLHDRHMHLVLLAWFLVFFVVFVGFSLLFIPHLSLLIFFHHSLPSLLLNSILLSFTSSPLVPPLFSSSCLFSSCSPPPCLSFHSLLTLLFSFLVLVHTLPLTCPLLSSALPSSSLLPCRSQWERAQMGSLTSSQVVGTQTHLTFKLSMRRPPKVCTHFYNTTQ